MDGRKVASIEVWPEVWEQMVALAAKNGRTIRDEIDQAFRRHLEKPPILILPPLDDAEVTPSTAKRPGRKRKSPPPAG